MCLIFIVFGNYENFMVKNFSNYGTFIYIRTAHTTQFLKPFRCYLPALNVTNQETVVFSTLLIQKNTL